VAKSASPILYTQRHDGVDYIIPVLLKSLDCFLSRHRRLGHDELDILALKTAVVDFLIVIIVLLWLLGFNLLALAVLV
jgi:hypothetical protein